MVGTQAMKITVFQEKQSQAWFYAFSKDWSTYRSNRGYDTKQAAERAGVEHWQSLIPSENSPSRAVRGERNARYFGSSL
jgi:hypothetical protein